MRKHLLAPGWRQRAWLRVRENAGLRRFLSGAGIPISPSRPAWAEEGSGHRGVWRKGAHPGPGREGAPTGGRGAAPAGPGDLGRKWVDSGSAADRQRARRSAPSPEVTGHRGFSGWLGKHMETEAWGGAGWGGRPRRASGCCLAARPPWLWPGTGAAQEALSGHSHASPTGRHSSPSHGAPGTQAWTLIWAPLCYLCL